MALLILLRARNLGILQEIQQIYCIIDSQTENSSKIFLNGWGALMMNKT